MSWLSWVDRKSTRVGALPAGTLSKTVIPWASSACLACASTCERSRVTSPLLARSAPAVEPVSNATTWAWTLRLASSQKVWNRSDWTTPRVIRSVALWTPEVIGPARKAALSGRAFFTRCWRSVLVTSRLLTRVATAVWMAGSRASGETVLT